MINYNKVVILCRAVSGSGKDTFANYFNHLIPFYGQKPVICIADEYMYENGVYKFEFSKLGMAHQKCKNKFDQAIREGKRLIIVANTNTKESDFKFYSDRAAAYNYIVFSIIIENRHNGKNVHGVEEEILNRQAQNIINSLKLK